MPKKTTTPPLGPAVLSGFLALFAVSCTADVTESDPRTLYFEDWADSDFASAGKVAALSEWADPLRADQPTTGTIDENIRLFRLELEQGGRLLGDLVVTSGDLSPHFSLAKEGGALSSTSMSVSDSVLQKTYQIDEAGTYVVIVRAFRDLGSGEFSFALHCLNESCGPIDDSDCAGLDDCQR